MELWIRSQDKKCLKLAELEDNMVGDNEMIVVRENAMGSLYYEIYGGEE